MRRRHSVIEEDDIETDEGQSSNVLIFLAIGLFTLASWALILLGVKLLIETIAQYV